MQEVESNLFGARSMWPLFQMGIEGRQWVDKNVGK